MAKKKPKNAQEVLVAGMNGVRQYLVDRHNWHLDNAERLREAINSIDRYDHDDPLKRAEAATKTFLGLSETRPPKKKGRAK